MLAFTRLKLIEPSQIRAATSSALKIFATLQQHSKHEW